MKIGKYSFGIGDRFGRQGKAQLQAFVAAAAAGGEITPVWNKSHREHTTIGTTPDSVRKEADNAVAELGWDKPYFVDADHINAGNIDPFLNSADFFTLDVADVIGQKAPPAAIERFVERWQVFVGDLRIPDLDQDIKVTPDFLREVAAKYLLAVQQAAALYGKIAGAKNHNCIIEVSMDETNSPQQPAELFFILAAIAEAGIPAQTIAPKFSGRFNKGVDYVGDLDKFAQEFKADTAVIKEAVRRFKLPANLKLSVHSGSDKFSIYPAIRQTMQKFNSGIHLKTAGTTWLEECIGLAEGSDSGLKVVKEIYAAAYQRRAELAEPYATVIDIDQQKLPPPLEVAAWDGQTCARYLRHNTADQLFNPSLRQLIHVGYKVAAEMGDRYLAALDDHQESVGRCVKHNILERHIRPLFLS